MSIEEYFFESPNVCAAIQDADGDIELDCMDIQPILTRGDVNALYEHYNGKPNNVWLSMKKFKEEKYFGWCWVVYKKAVLLAFHDLNENFRTDRDSFSVFHSDQIILVMPWRTPKNPVDNIDL